MRRALITGITGQDGSYLAELLLAKGYEVHGIVRRASTLARTRIDHLLAPTGDRAARIQLHYGDLADSSSLTRLLAQLQPDEIYNLASQSHVRVSFEIPAYTADINAVGTARLLEGIMESGLREKTRFFQASSCEVFGRPRTTPQTEDTPFRPCSPYACAKAFAHWLTVNYRDAHGLFACSGLLYNHESPRRGENFVTRKITRAVGRIKLGLQSELHLGTLDARRDWGYAPEYVEGIWLMLQQEQPDDYLLATGEDHSVRDFLEAAFAHAGLDWQRYVRFDARQLRPTESGLLVGDPSKARRQLGWQPRTRLRQLAALMVDADLALAHSERSKIRSPSV